MSSRQMAQLLQRCWLVQFRFVCFFLKTNGARPHSVSNHWSLYIAYNCALCWFRKQRAALSPCLSEILNLWNSKLNMSGRNVLSKWTEKIETVAYGLIIVCRSDWCRDAELSLCNFGMPSQSSEWRIQQSGKGREKKHTKNPACIPVSPLVQIFLVLPQYCTHVTSLFSPS